MNPSAPASAGGSGSGSGLTPAPLAGWQAFALRPAGQARSLLVALRRAGAQAEALALARLVDADPQTLAGALTALAEARTWIFTSPAAVRSCARLGERLGLDLFAPTGVLAQAAERGRVLAPGPGTAQALARLGVAPVATPTRRLDSEGLLARPELAAPASGIVALVGAPGGRGLLEAELARRGARVEALHVYRRQPATPAPRVLQALATCPRPLLLASSSALLARLVQVLAPDRLDHVRTHGHLVVASERLAEQARTLGFDRLVVAGSALPQALVAAAIGLAQTVAAAAAAHDSVSMAP